MKRWIAVVLLIGLCASLFAGCEGMEQLAENQETQKELFEEENSQNLQKVYLCVRKVITLQNDEGTYETTEHTWKYTERGQIAEYSCWSTEDNDEEKCIYTYNREGKIQYATIISGGTEYKLEAVYNNGRLTEYTDGEESLFYRYDERGRLVSQDWGKAGRQNEALTNWATLTYYPSGKIESVQVRGIDTYIYDENGIQIEQITQLNSNSYERRTFEYTPEGERRNKTIYATGTWPDNQGDIQSYMIVSWKETAEGNVGPAYVESSIGAFVYETSWIEENRMWVLTCKIGSGVSKLVITVDENGNVVSNEVFWNGQLQQRTTFSYKEMQLPEDYKVPDITERQYLHDYFG